jgi:hypothetical protein
MVLQGSPCSQLGEIGFEKSFPQLCLEASALASSIVDSWLESAREGVESLCMATSTFEDAAPLILPWLPFADTDIGVDCGGGSLAVSPSLVLLNPLAASDLAWKNPLRLCWPLFDPFVLPGCDPDLFRFAAGITASGFCALLKPAERAGLATGTESLGAVPISPLSTAFSVPLPRSGSTIEMDVDRLLTSISSDSAILFCDDNEGFRENMSLMLRRRSNSGMSFPDMGNRFFVDHSPLRLPPSNIPGGLTTSLIYVSLPSRLTFSFRTP